MQFYDMKIKNKTYLTNDEIIEYFKYLRQGKLEYRNKIIENYYKLALSIVYKFKNVNNYNTIEDDLIGASMLGLVKAVDTFDIDKNTKFIIYSSLVIKNEILMFLRKNKKNLLVNSLNEAIICDNDENELYYEDVIYDKEYDIYKIYEEKETMIETITKTNYMLDYLDDRGKYIITHFFGIGCKAIDQKEIAAHLNCSQSYISRLIKKHLLQMKTYYITNYKNPIKIK